MLDQLERMGANLLLLDCPPVLPVSDTLAVAQQVDGVVVTAVPEQTRKRHLRDAVNRLKGVDAGILGLVLSGVSETARRYYKYPSYGEDEYGDGHRRGRRPRDASLPLGCIPRHSTPAPRWSPPGGGA